MVIDLHGLTEAEAIPKVESFIYSFINSDQFEATIITGNGIVLKDVVIEAIQENNLHWKQKNHNKGALIVYK